jgi:hypothetical protein
MNFFFIVFFVLSHSAFSDGFSQTQSDLRNCFYKYISNQPMDPKRLRSIVEGVPSESLKSLTTLANYVGANSDFLEFNKVSASRKLLSKVQKLFFIFCVLKQQTYLNKELSDSVDSYIKDLLDRGVKLLMCEIKLSDRRQKQKIGNGNQVFEKSFSTFVTFKDGVQQTKKAREQFFLEAHALEVSMGDPANFVEFFFHQFCN